MITNNESKQINTQQSLRHGTILAAYIIHCRKRSLILSQSTGSHLCKTQDIICTNIDISTDYKLQTAKKEIYYAILHVYDFMLDDFYSKYRNFDRFYLNKDYNME